MIVEDKITWRLANPQIDNNVLFRCLYQSLLGLYADIKPTLHLAGTEREKRQIRYSSVYSLEVLDATQIT